MFSNGDYCILHINNNDKRPKDFVKTVATQKPNGLYLISILKTFVCFYETLRVVSAHSVYSHLCAELMVC